MHPKVGIIFVHGIVGSNRTFEFLASSIPHSYTLMAIELDGHGGDALGFSRASMQKWKKQIAQAVAHIGATCDKIIGVGHSMGCLLLLEEALKENLDALLLLNPPLKIKIKARFFLNSLKVALGKTKNDEVAKAAKDSYGISLDPNPLHYYGWPKRFLELLAESRHISRHLPHGIHCPVTAILSAGDEVVSLSSAKILENSPQTKVIILPESHHYFYPPSDRKIIINALKTLLEQ